MKTFMKLALLVVVVGAFGMAWMAFRLSPDVEHGAPAPDVTLATLEGTDLPVSDLRGKVVLLDFWSST